MALLADFVPFSYHLMFGGSALFILCLFMLSLTQPQQYYQAATELAQARQHLEGPSDIPERACVRRNDPGVSLLWLIMYIAELSLKTIENGLSPSFAFYTVPPFLDPSIGMPNEWSVQLVILNATNGVGRVLPNIFARPLGVFNLMIFCMASLGVLVFCMLPVKDIPGTVVFAVLFGFFPGTCES
ncbi:hypothetical protein H0H81_012187 [Sphagnurus paluster]|uniref:Uncharacterized protein n=1 Tax=Sphagnurus paluster TaxID=117069 RepID=A0A9P7K4S9_9AGAR|nr:hypothetical protein H0H81_012187 [Sphagnurus paluster]